MNFKIVIMFIFLTFDIAYSQITINSVLSFTPGEGQNTGQSPQFFPANIYGIPSRMASEQTQAAAPEEVLSIGLGGEIIIYNSDNFVIDKPGPDFTIFENAFINPLTNKIFAEPAIVSVSEDGIKYFDFPCDSLTLEGCAGTKPTYGNHDPFNPNVSGGNQFDIAQLGLSKIKYIKIKDITKMLLDNPGHPYYDPILSGFDLDAVVLNNSVSVTSTFEEFPENMVITVNRCMLNILKPGKFQLRLFDLYGKLLYSNIFFNKAEVQIQKNFPLFALIEFNGNSYLKKILY